MKVAPPILALETATARLGVALWQGGALRGEASFERREGHAESLHSLIKLVLEVSGCSLADLGAVAVDIGPGAFTALRVGMAAAKGLAYALGKPLLGVSSLEVLAHNLPLEGALLAPLLDARRLSVCGAVYRVRAGAMEEVRPRITASPAEFGALLQGLGQPLTLLGSGARLYRAELAAAVGKSAAFADPVCDQPRAATLAALAERQWERGLTLDLMTCAPLYLREGVDPALAAARPAPKGKACRRPGKSL